MATDKIKLCYAILTIASEKRVSPMLLRGYLAHMFANISEFHHHSPHANHYPLIQYKRIDGKLAVIGMSEYADVVYENMASLDHITTKTEKISLENIELKKTIYTPDILQLRYEFTSPWIALNEKNYAEFRKLKGQEKKRLLERILVGNILSMLKGLGIFTDQRIVVSIERWRSVITTAHDNKFAGIFCKWSSNLALPEYCGLGKSVSKGFGVIERIK